MTRTHTTNADSTSAETRVKAYRPNVLPLKAERIQLVILTLAEPNRPYDFAAETESERDARLDAGWRKRIRPAAPRSEHRAA